ncbi:MAG: excinuclease ABC subunit UvrC [Candidatus Aminicenantales bacterium]
MSEHDALKARAAELPDKPGIYFFKNAAGRVVYIGKARSLRDRVRTYFLPNPDYKVRNILQETAGIDYILTGSEKEAAFLENNYIQQHQPRFNLRLKDDKSFPYLKVTAGEKYPGIYFSRKVGEGRSRYFGPFSPAHRARTSIHLVNKYFRVRGCEDAVFRNRKRPCLEYDLKLCSAPCVHLIPEQDYRGDVENACLFLEGRTRELSGALKKKMEAAAAAQDFEEAARWRDILRTMEDIRERPRAISIALEDQDAVGFARRGVQAAVYVFFMRRGKIRDSASAVLETGEGDGDAAILGNFLLEFYEGRERPPRLLLPFPVDGQSRLERLLCERKRSGARAGDGRPEARIAVPRSGKRRKLTDLANRNAEALLDKKERESLPVEELGRVLGLERPPRTIEGFDISNTGGQESVGSMVVFRDGRPDKDEYRKFRIRTVEGPNDVASLEEVIGRRYRRRIEDSRPMPDLIMVDGGKGQLAAAEKALAGLGVSDVPLVSIAKREEILFTPGHREGIRLPRTAPALKLVQAIRDEAHRFAITFHRGRREKRSFASELDGIPGLGPKKKTALLTKYKSLEEIREATAEALAPVIGGKLAAVVLQRLKFRQRAPDLS